MYSVKDDGILSHRVAPFGNLRVNAFFQLTEAYRRLRVLHRLLMPRHPPAALTSLTIIFGEAMRLNRLCNISHDSIFVLYIAVRYFFALMKNIPQALIVLIDIGFVRVITIYVSAL